MSFPPCMAWIYNDAKACLKRVFDIYVIYYIIFGDKKLFFAQIAINFTPTSQPEIQNPSL